MGVVCRVHKRDPWQCGCYRLDYVGPRGKCCFVEGCDVGLLGHQEEGCRLVAYVRGVLCVR